MSFEAKDLELEEDVDSEDDHNYEQEFSWNKEKFCHILDQVLYDVNCLNFFDKNQIVKVNDYLEAFKHQISFLVIEMKNNFSKM